MNTHTDTLNTQCVRWCSCSHQPKSFHLYYRNCFNLGHALRFALRNFYNKDIYLTQNWYENGMAAVAVAAIIITDLTTIPIGNVGFNVSGGEWADGAKKAYTQNEILKRITTTKSVYNQKHTDSQTCIWKMWLNKFPFHAQQSTNASLHFVRSVFLFCPCICLFGPDKIQ